MTLRDLIPVPPHIDAAANVCRYDLLHGPSWLVIPDNNPFFFTEDHHATYPDDLREEYPSLTPLETYTSPIADALRSFISELPSTVYHDRDCDNYSISFPEPYTEEETQEVIEPYLENIFELSRKDIIRSLFGKVIANDFS